VIHIILHFLLPVAVAVVFYRKQWKKVSLVFCATMLVDVDHLIAEPVYDAFRCSINYHPLHSYWAIAVYCILLLPKKSRIVAIGLLTHMLLDWQDCYYKLSVF